VTPSPRFLQALSDLCQPIRAGAYPQTLRPMRALLAALGNPQRKFPAVVVAGSTGKGTTCHHIARLLRAGGLNVGLYTSPHLHIFRERFSINEIIITEDEFVEGFEAVHAASAKLNYTYSTFEQATALAAWWFARQKIDIAVLEIGLGGRFDAVNAIDNVLSVFTRIETEHAAMLGGSLKSVAWHKAGIIRPGGHAVTVKQQTDVYMILSAEARIKNARLHLDGGRSYTQDGQESLLALAAWQNLLERGVIPRRAFQIGINFNSLGLPGRLEQVKVHDRTILIDGGHTPASARYLLSEIMRKTGVTKPVRMVIGMLQDKSASEYLHVFDSPRFHVVLTQAPGHRANTPEALLSQSDFHYATVETIPRLQDALDGVYTAPENLTVVAGSLRMAATAREAFGLLSEDDIAEAQATRSIFDGAAYLSKLDVTRLAEAPSKKPAIPPSSLSSSTASAH
jgi:dihydrofolate synthase / folylpolyglutamate synthase